MAPYGKELSEDLKKRIVALHKDELGYNKIAKTLKLSSGSTKITGTMINVFGSDGVMGVWWQPGEEYKDKRVLPTVKHGGGSVMV